MVIAVVTRVVQGSRGSARLFGQTLAFNRTLATSSARRLSLSRVNQEDNSALTGAGLISKDPYVNFRHWFDQACQSKSVIEPNAVSVATANKDGRPSTRMVLLNVFNERGFQFFTKYTSNKGRDLEENPFACMMFYWEALYKVVRIQGSVEKLSEEVSTTYFHMHPRNIQLTSCVSPQSRPIPDIQRRPIPDLQVGLMCTQSRPIPELQVRVMCTQSRPIPDIQTLGADFGAAMKEYEDESIPIPKPESWGGFILKPDHFEFWQGHAATFPDRFVFRRPAPGETIDNTVTHEGDNGWYFERLAP
ncbi:Pyridoxine-5'-phosphate oxidase [Lamellibrachia satsuma]|nr:Pyridoxine-5'-phosphate oxidase [Lamellibrachia satsuma]